MSPVPALAVALVDGATPDDDRVEAVLGDALGDHRRLERLGAVEREIGVVLAGAAPHVGLVPISDMRAFGLRVR